MAEAVFLDDKNIKADSRMNPGSIEAKAYVYTVLCNTVVCSSTIRSRTMA
jgi:hypothetical protein